MEAREIVQLLRALVEDPHSGLPLTVTTVLKILNRLLASLNTRHAYNILTYMHTLSYTHKIHIK